MTPSAGSSAGPSPSAQDPARASETAQWLCYVGLLPFVGATATLALGGEAWHDTALQALIGYGAVILGFLGAVHWGLALREQPLDHRRHYFGWGVLPALAGWLALMIPPRTGLGLLFAGYALQYAADRHATVQDALPLWYERLRLKLSQVVLLSLAIAWALA